MSKMKILHLEIHNCSECPYSEYDTYYSSSANSGYDCTKGNFRIITDKGNRISDLSKVEIPNECPLKDLSQFREDNINDVLG